MIRSNPAEQVSASAPAGLGVVERHRLLIVFLRAPRLHHVKTRLAAELGAERALAVYRRLLEVLLGNLGSLRSVQLRFTPDDAGPEVVPWARPGWQLAPQGAGDLGERLQRAFAEAFQHGYGRVAVIGSDCPTVTMDDVESAWDGLGRSDVVLGPASDGGYWLAALKRPFPGLFEGMSWGGSSVLARTLARAQADGLSALLLDERHDIDTRADWDRYQRKQAGLAHESEPGKVRPQSGSRRGEVRAGPPKRR